MAFVIPEKRCLILKPRDPHKLIATIPQAQVMHHEGTPLVAVPHTTPVIKVLQNMGMSIEGLEPYWHYYDTKPLVNGEFHLMAHQDKTAAFWTVNPRCFILHPPRMGKTASAIAAIGYLWEEKLLNSVLVVAPNSCLHSVWGSEFQGMFIQKSVALLRGSKDVRRKLLHMNFDVFVINPDGLKVLKQDLIQVIRSGRINAVVLDESREWANPQTDLWRTTEEIIRPCEYVVEMTGTPGDPEDCYGQIKLIKPENVPKFKTAWRDMTMYQYGNPAFKQYKPRPGSELLVKKAMSPAIRYAKADVMDLPPLQFLTREPELTKEQKKVYEELRKDSIALLQAGSITAATASVLNTKLLQVCSGAVRADDENPVFLDISNRLREVETLISESESKVIIFAPYKAPMLLLEQELIKRKYTVARVDGSVTGHKRDRIFTNFQHSATPQVLIAHPQTTAYGLELAVADTIIFWGPPQNGAFMYQQAIERINSAKQKSKSPAIVHIVSSPAERRGFANIKDGVDVDTDIVKQFEEIVREEI